MASCSGLPVTEVASAETPKVPGVKLAHVYVHGDSTVVFPIGMLPNEPPGDTETDTEAAPLTDPDRVYAPGAAWKTVDPLFTGVMSLNVSLLIVIRAVAVSVIPAETAVAVSVQIAW